MELAVENNVHKFTQALRGSFRQGVFGEKLRAKALELLESNRFPTSHDEYWKYTRVNRISTKEFKIQHGELTSIESFKIKGLDSNAFVFVNGFFSEKLSTFSDECKSLVSVYSLLGGITSEYTIENGIFDQLNTAFATDGLHISIPKNVILEQPIEIIHVQTGNEVIGSVFHHVDVARLAQANVVMTFHSLEATNSFVNVKTNVSIEDGAHLTMTKVQTESNQNYHIATENVNQAENSNFTINTIILGGELVRNNLNIRVNGQNCETNLNSAYILKGNQHVDNHTLVDHRVANCLSNELYKGVIDDKAIAVFNGKVFVRKDAQKINAFQSNGNVLLSDSASVNSKPELEIYADDVKCSHGSTTGQLDDKAVFYLRSRGLSEKQAREMLVQAFVGDVLAKLDEPIQEFVNQVLEQRFGWDLV
jgi:Fe-S cluster assembly protein SufD